VQLDKESRLEAFVGINLRQHRHFRNAVLDVVTPDHKRVVLLVFTITDRKKTFFRQTD
jgi:hypothetical protein